MSSNAIAADGIVVGVGAPVVLALGDKVRNAAIIHSNTNTLYVKCGYGASDMDYTYKLTRNSTLEITGYSGVLTARAAGGSTYVRVTEII